MSNREKGVRIQLEWNDRARVLEILEKLSCVIKQENGILDAHSTKMAEKSARLFLMAEYGEEHGHVRVSVVEGHVTGFRIVASIGDFFNAVTTEWSKGKEIEEQMDLFEVTTPHDRIAEVERKIDSLESRVGDRIEDLDDSIQEISRTIDSEMDDRMGKLIDRLIDALERIK